MARAFLGDAPDDPWAHSVTMQQEELAAELKSFRVAAELSNRSVVDLAFDDAEASRDAFNRWRTVDPFPEISPALLNVADVADYLATTGMVYPARAFDLKSASLRIRVEGEYQYVNAEGDVVKGVLLPSDHPDFNTRKATDVFVLEGNTIAFLTLEPIFQIPDYMAMRFNLVIDHVYKGLLLGTGPLVDPGYVGKLHIPLHNLTQNAYEFRAGDPLIWAEFTKLSPNRAFQATAKSNSARRRGRFSPYVHYGPSSSSISNFLRDAVGAAAVPQSSIPAAIAISYKAQKGAAQTAKNIRNISLGAGLAVLVALATVLIPVVQMVQTANTELRQAEVRNAQYEDRIARLERAVSTETSATATPSTP